MTGTLTPRLEVLPPEQRALWPALAATPSLGFALYGGTAVALRLGHRTSVDFDFFTEAPLDRDALRARLDFVDGASVIQDRGRPGPCWWPPRPARTRT